MTMKPTKRDNLFAFLLLTSTTLFSLLLSVQSIHEAALFPKLVTEVREDPEKDIRAVFVPGVLAYPVVSQPQGDPLYVSNKPGFLTLFQSAEQYHVTGLLAHNFLSGQAFSQFSLGEDVWIVYEDGGLRRYQITGIRRFQKLSPFSSRSQYRDLRTQEIFTTSQLFKRFYRGSHHVTFQTCLDGDGLSNWGLLFVVATPAGHNPLYQFPSVDY